MGCEDRASWAHRQQLDPSSAALTKNLIQKSTFAKEGLFSLILAAKVAYLEELELLELNSGVGLTFESNRAKTIVHKYFLSHRCKEKLHECLRYLAAAAAINHLIDQGDWLLREQVRTEQLIGSSPLTLTLGNDGICILVQQHISMAALHKQISCLASILGQHIYILVDSGDKATSLSIRPASQGDCPQMARKFQRAPPDVLRLAATTFPYLLSRSFQPVISWDYRALQTRPPWNKLNLSYKNSPSTSLN